MPETSVITRGMYVSSGKSSGAPIASHSTGGRSNSAEPAAKPSAGSVNAETAIAPAPWTVTVMNRRRVTVSPSNAPGMPRSRVYLLLGSLRPSAMGGTQNNNDVRRASGAPTAQRDARAGGGSARRHGAAQRAGSTRFARSRGSLGGLQLRPAAMRHGGHAGGPDGLGALGIALGVRLRRERDHVGQLADRRDVPQLGEAGEPEREQPVAGQQGEVRILRPHDAARAVVLEVALEDRLHQQRVGVLMPGGARPGGRCGAERAVRGDAVGERARDQA